MITRWRTRPEPRDVEAVEWLGYTEDVRPLFGEALVEVTADRRLFVPTLRGGRFAQLGDWIVRDAAGELSVWQEPGFHAYHEPLQDTRPDLMSL
ncbi:hypothetical protein AB0I81_40160 [Nonomuraea sp. NPDC050404]|uniref:hypothetical protein n=1 Tax=Nonomuraea sp. NPDC050404 TaxID=3155783 RepID=UPI003410D9B3